MLVRKCDICKNEDNKVDKYILPLVEKYDIMNGGKSISSFQCGIRPKEVDLCEECAEKVHILLHSLID